jgi:hypothetical protein
VVDISIYNRGTAAQTDVSVAVTDERGDRVDWVWVKEQPPATMDPKSLALTTLQLGLGSVTETGEYSYSIWLSFTGDPRFSSINVPLRLRINPLGDTADLVAAPSPLLINAQVNSPYSNAILSVKNEGNRVPTSLDYAIEPASAESFFDLGLYAGAQDFGAGSSIQIPVYFRPTVRGTMQIQLVIKYTGISSSGYSYQKILIVPITGIASAPQITLSSTRKKQAPPIKHLPPRFLGDLGDILPQRPPILLLDVGAVQPPVSDVTSFYIRNSGDAPLEISAFRTDNASIGAGQTVPFSIAPGHEELVKIDLGVYRAMTVGSFSETISIISNDPINREATVILKGAVIGTKYQFRPDSLVFDTVSVNSPVTRTASLENLGTVDLRIGSLGGLHGEFAIIHPPALGTTVTAGTSLTFEVQCLSRAPGRVSDMLIIGLQDGAVARLPVSATIF